MNNIFNMFEWFKITTTTITGTSHTADSKCNEDSYSYRVHENFIVACVSDGCSGVSNSSFGSDFTSKFVVSFLYDKLYGLTKEELKMFSRPYLLEMLRVELFNAVFEKINTFDYRFNHISTEYFASTIVITIITPEITDIYSIGDGHYFVNNESKEIKTLKDLGLRINVINTASTPYFIDYFAETVGYNKVSQQTIKFRLIKSMNTLSINDLMIGSDGVSVLDNEMIKNAICGPISELFHLNSNELNDRLDKASKKYPDLFHDDLTMVLFKSKN